MTFKTFVLTSTIAIMPLAAFAEAETQLIEETGGDVEYHGPDRPMVDVVTDGTMFPDARHLIVAESICENDKADIIDWAAGTEGYASLAVPQLPADVPQNCGVQNDEVVTGMATDFQSFEASDKVALDICNASLLDGYGECFIIARVTDQDNIAMTQ